MRNGVAKCFTLSLLLGGCALQLSPPQLVGPETSDIAVQEFLYAGKLLAYAYGYDLKYDVIPARLQAPSIPQLLDVANKSVPYSLTIAPDVTIEERLGNPTNFKERLNRRIWARDYFIRVGYHASQLICRNYLSGLRDRNEYFEHLQKELRVATNLTGTLLTITSASEKSKDIFNAVVSGVNLGMDEYQSFRFLDPQIETVLPLVEAAQVAMRNYYVDTNPETGGAPAGFAGALNAVNRIEYQCTRSGIRAIINKQLISAEPKFTVVNGILLAHKAKEEKPAQPIKTPASQQSRW